MHNLCFLTAVACMVANQVSLNTKIISFLKKLIREAVLSRTSEFKYIQAQPSQRARSNKWQKYTQATGYLAKNITKVAKPSKCAPRTIDQRKRNASDIPLVVFVFIHNLTLKDWYLGEKRLEESSEWNMILVMGKSREGCLAASAHLSSSIDRCRYDDGLWDGAVR